MSTSGRIGAYEGEPGRALVAAYEKASPAQMHAWMNEFLPSSPGAILDVGAGSGRDAAWLAAQGHEVVAVEPSETMRSAAQSLHSDPRITWLDDRLPGLDKVLRLGIAFDVILLSAVWMNVAAADRARALRKLLTLLKPGGIVAITLRQGPVDPSRQMYPVSVEEVERFARAQGAVMVHESEAADALHRPDISWRRLALRLPDDGTGALPLLRHVVLNDAKASTYKLGLLRAVARAADGAQGMAHIQGEDAVTVPLGLIALNWLRLYVPLIRAGLPQTPTNAGAQGLGFTRHGWGGMENIAPLDLRVGSIFTGARASDLHAALRAASNTITTMPARYMTFPGTSARVMVAQRERAGRAPDPLILDKSYLQRFGSLTLPVKLWRSLTRFDVWIEPSLVAEWQRLMARYAERQGRRLDPAAVSRAMTWHDPSRDVGFVRQLAHRVIDQDQVYCVWSGRRLTRERLDIDHCLPWSAWPCDDLWNLLPADRTVNQRHKRDRLPSAALLERAQDAIADWWDRGYGRGDATAYRFLSEVSSTLPNVLGDRPGADEIFAGLQLRRSAIRTDHQVAQWDGPARERP